MPPSEAQDSSQEAESSSVDQNHAVSSSTAKPTVTKKGRERRKAPYPNSILDRRVLQQALDERGLNIKQMHIDGFYQALHRQHYPDLPDFCEQFERYEQEVVTDRKKTNSNNNDDEDDHESAVLKTRNHNKNNNCVSDLPAPAPLKNAVTRKKNRNRMQLPKALLNFLKDSPNNGLVTLTSKVAVEKKSADGTTTKLAIELHDGKQVESVLMRYITHGGSRASLCVSSQCGCAMGCTFCATGTMGLLGSLSTGEILEQLVHADRILAREWQERQQTQDLDSRSLQLDLVRNVVFMGQGEPLDNYANVVEACRALLDRKRWNLAHGRVTVSTVGLTSQIRKLTRDIPEVSLALSLHAPNQKLRESIVPTAKRYPIEELIQALDEHMMAYLKQRRERHANNNGNDGSSESFTMEERIQESTRRRAMIEYVMLQGPTCSFEAAHELGKLCENRHLVVNLIPYNATDVKDKLQCPTREHMEQFRDIVISYGAFCTIRKTMGADIDSACGQLITQKKDKSTTVAATTATGGVVRDIEDTGMSLLAALNVSATTRRTIVRKVHESAKTPPRKDLAPLIRPLAMATTVAATCFVISTALFIRQRRR